MSGNAETITARCAESVRALVAISPTADQALPEASLSVTTGMSGTTTDAHEQRIAAEAGKPAA